jgi:hypothetical protein
MDIREVLAAMNEDDKRLWQQHRTEMRRSYLTAHNSALGLSAWDMYDDAFLDLIDIKLAYVFDRAGRLVAHKELIGGDADKIEAKIEEQGASLSVNAPVIMAPVAETAVAPTAKELVDGVARLLAVPSAATASMMPAANSQPVWPTEPKEIVAK